MLFSNYSDGDPDALSALFFGMVALKFCFKFLSVISTTLDILPVRKSRWMLSLLMKID